ncbi:MAG TPA: carboxypeptidase-like regulatory domain-containing protein [Thermoleophilaceae bacterium]|nr:carboxypeptidase-like regulatory domain-containing protein [Thermoleophilaceae bacterium]
MKARVSIAALALAGVTAAAAAAAGPAAVSSAVTKADPEIRQMVVFGDGSKIAKRVRAARTTVKVDGRSCAVGARTPLAALARARPGKMRLFDYGSCSARVADAAGLFVKSIRGQVNHGLNGWVYKVRRKAGPAGAKLGTAGAADLAGPFGRGRLRPGDRVIWFYCVFEAGSCQRSLELAWTLAGRELSVSVTGYDDSGDGAPVAGATVVAEPVGGDEPRRRGTTAADGKAPGMALAPGDYLVHARKRGAIPSFDARVTVR